jgi:hypothetical protein
MGVFDRDPRRSVGELTRAARVRLHPRAALTRPEDLASAQWLTDELAVLVEFALADGVVVASEDDVAETGGLAHWARVGRDNLRADLAAAPPEHDVVHRGTERAFHVLMGESAYTASQVLFLPELLRLVGCRDEGTGALVCMPFQHQVALQVIDCPAAALAINDLAEFATEGYTRAPGGLSPHVHWVRDGRWVRVTDVADGRATVRFGDDLARLLDLAGH